MRAHVINMAGRFGAPCIVTDTLDGETLSGGAGAPYCPCLRWKSRKQLNVQFLSSIPTWRRAPNPPGNFLATSDILQWANVWSSEKLGLEGVPKFVEWREGDEGESDIRVKFGTIGGSKSLIGINAESHRGEATMILNLAKDDDGYRQYTVIHEFGHALGLGHEHQMPRLAEAIDESAMIKYLVDSGMTEDKAKEKFKRDFISYSEASENTVPEKAEFDPQSIMSYPIPEECIKMSHRDRFTREQLEMITSQSYNKRTTLSEIDIKTIKKLYPSDHPGTSIAGPSSTHTKLQPLATRTDLLNRGPVRPSPPHAKPQSIGPIGRSKRCQNRMRSPYERNRLISPPHPRRAFRQQNYSPPASWPAKRPFQKNHSAKESYR